MDEKRSMLRHFLAALAYRTQKALRGAPPDFGHFAPPNQIRSPAGLVHHMTSVLGYARTCFVGGTYRPDELPTLADEVTRFHEMLEDLGRHLEHLVETASRWHDRRAAPAGTVLGCDDARGPARDAPPARRITHLSREFRCRGHQG